jgi:hypothetical protein
VMTVWHCPLDFYQPAASFFARILFYLVCNQIAGSSTGRVIHILNCYELRVNLGRFATSVRWTDAFRLCDESLRKLIRRFRISRCEVAQFYSPLIHP